MKKIISFILMLTPYLLLAQEKKPTIMILPSDYWCVARYYTTTYQDDGRTVRVSDYRRAFQEDPEIGSVIAAIGEKMTDLGYSLKDAEQELKNLEQREIEDDATTSKTGSSIAESPLDKLKRKTRSDIIIQIGWQITNETGGIVVNSTIEAFDAYTSKRVATATGFSKATQDNIQKAIVKGISSQIKAFDKQLTKYFSGLRKTGREIILTVRRWDSWDKDLESEFTGEDLLDIIQNWLTQNTVGGNFNLSDATENFVLFEQVRIPLTNDKGVAVDARAFATDLRKYLQKSPYNITAKVLTRGLGEAIVILGEK